MREVPPGAVQPQADRVWPPLLRDLHGRPAEVRTAPTRETPVPGARPTASFLPSISLPSVGGWWRAGLRGRATERTLALRWLSEPLEAQVSWGDRTSQSPEGRLGGRCFRGSVLGTGLQWDVLSLSPTIPGHVGLERLPLPLLTCPRAQRSASLPSPSSRRVLWLCPSPLVPNLELSFHSASPPVGETALKLSLVLAEWARSPQFPWAAPGALVRSGHRFSSVSILLCSREPLLLVFLQVSGPHADLLSQGLRM